MRPFGRFRRYDVVRTDRLRYMFGKVGRQLFAFCDVGEIRRRKRNDSTDAIVAGYRSLNKEAMFA